MSDKIFTNNLNVILIQIDEAHSTEWPVGIKSILNIDQPNPQTCMLDRMNRAKQFIENYNPPFEVFVDDFSSNEFAETYRAWPDIFYCVDKNLKIISKSVYHKDGDMEAKIIEDYTDLLENLINKK